MTQEEPRIIIALDYDTPAEAVALADSLRGEGCRMKIGKELFTRGGPAVVEAVMARGFEVFLDLKFHDIPNTVAAACRAAAELGVWMMNVHASGGRRMMEAAREALEQAGSGRPRLIAVTVLTSLDQADLREIGWQGTPAENVMRLAGLARDCGLDGVVCSPREAAELRQAMGEEFLLVTPGVRPAGSEAGDQRRVMTPAEALAAGATHLVIGRPITRAPDPAQALASIEAEL